LIYRKILFNLILEKMRRNLFLVLMLFISAVASAQIRWNAKVGINASNFTSDLKGDAKLGLKVGGGLDYAFDKTWSLQPSLLITSKGAKDSDDGTDATINAVYLELPIMVAAHVEISDKANLLVNAGPYFAYGIAGKTTEKADGVEVSVDTFGDKLPFRRFDAGLGVGVGLDFGQFVIALESEFGMVDVVKDVSSKNANISLSVTYKF
jgi:opacity protein-like surface antigen